MRLPHDRSETPARPAKARARWDPFDETADAADAPHPAFSYTAPPELRIIRGIILAVLALIGVVATYTALWFGLAWWLRDGAQDWMIAERDRGRMVDAGAVVVGGFPFSLRLTVEAPSYGVLGFDGDGYRWRGTHLVVSSRIWAPTRAEVDFTGPYTLMRTGPGGTRTLTGTANRLSARFGLSEPLTGKIEVDVHDLFLANDQGRPVLSLGAGRFRYTGGGASRVGSQRTIAEARLRLDHIRLSALADFPLGPDVRRLEAAVGLTGLLVYDPAAPAQDFVRWRDGGGTIEVPGLAVDYGPLRLQTSGTLALDQDLQPIGAFTARIEGFFELIDALWRQGIVTGPDAVTAKVVLGAFAKKHEGATHSSISLPLTIHGRRLYVGPVPLLDVPELIWPEEDGQYKQMGVNP